MGPADPPTQLHGEEKELNEATSSAHLGDSQDFTAFSPQTAVIDFFFLFLKRCSIAQVESRYQPDTSTGRGRRLETCSKLETCREQHFFSPSCQRRMFFQSGLGLSFAPSLPRTTPSQKQGGERTNELLIAGEQITEAPLRLPSVQTTCSGLRDCTVVCTLVRLCWDTPHTASAARGRQHLHGRGTCLDRVGSGDGCMQRSLISQPGRV